MQSIQSENILDIIFTYKSSINNVEKYLNLYAKVSALYIHYKCKMIQERVESFILQNYDKKDQDLKLLYHEIFNSFIDYLISQLCNLPSDMLNRNRQIKIKININIDQLKNKVK